MILNGISFSVCTQTEMLYSQVKLYTICSRGIYKSFAVFFLQNFFLSNIKLFFKIFQIIEYMYAFHIYNNILVSLRINSCCKC